MNTKTEDYEFKTAFKPKLIYVFRINDSAHNGCLKIGETTLNDSENKDILNIQPNSTILNKAAKERIDEYTRTASIAYDLIYTEIAVYQSDKRIRLFRDYDVHNVLLRSGITKREGTNWGTEWFETDLETVKNAIKAVKEGRKSLLAAEKTENKSPIIFRPEQREAIDKTLKQYYKGNKMLWNAKMRFGKTLCALQVVKELNILRTLIITHRPVVDDGWFKDFDKIFYASSNFRYGSKNLGEKYSTLENDAKNRKQHYVYFASIQDLRGSETVGGNFNKNDKIFSTPWDLIIIDEAHEGTQTELGQSVITELTKMRTKTLMLSGTPFNLFDYYKEDEIYTWDYIMEQKAKKKWEEEHFGDSNPYAVLPVMNIYTYDLGRLLHDYVDEDIAFNFKEFFRVNESGKFVHQKDVAAFLNLLCKKDEDSLYPFSNETYRNIFRHTLWMVPGVKPALALQRMLEKHSVFQHFTVVNVAGDGDPTEEENKKALSLLESKIGDDPDQTRTITLSCGRLTTGVTVEAWTAVFMLSGSFNTMASTYMQTIFRVQSPATFNGKMKEQCYVFDFAPDRTLKVLAEAAKVTTKAGGTSGDDRTVMGDFLNFCPVIGLEGSKMHKFDVDTMLQQLKKVYIARVVNNGFEDNYLYNDELFKLDSSALKEFKDLKEIIGQTKAMPKTDSVDINKQGLTNEEYEELESLEKKNRKKKDKPELTDEEKKRLEELKEKKKNRETAISILRGISIRMPLMIYGADINDEETEVTLDNFTSLIDNLSWDEFMPRGVTKERFNIFKKYYDPDIFAAAAKQIRSLARSADKLSIEQRIERITLIFAKFRNPDKETVLTPWRVVNMHISDTIGGYTFFDEDFKEQLSEPRFVDRGKVTSDVFYPETHILEINSKSGLYPLYMAYSTYRSHIASLLTSPESIEEEWKIWEKVVKENIFVICKTPMAKSITKRTLVGFRDITVNTRHFKDLINQIKNKPSNFIQKVAQGKSFWKANNNDNMKFNAIVGNPPYNIMDEGAGVSASPIYNLFVDVAKRLNPNFISMIMPARWYSGGKGLDDFRSRMLQDSQLSVIHDFLIPQDCFPTVQIKGGICYFLWHKGYSGTCFIVNHFNGKIASSANRPLVEYGLDTFIRFNEAISIIHKVQNLNEPSIKSQVSSRRPFGFDTKYRGKPNKDETHNILIYQNKGIGYVSQIEITKNKEYQSGYKVFVLRAGSGSDNFPHPVISTPFLGMCNSVCTETYMFLGRYTEKQNAENLVKYAKTKFLRFLALQLKSTQDTPAFIYKLVPLQDFTENSDIDWSKSVADIDKQLYAKYGLNDEEINFIESMIKPMA